MYFRAVPNVFEGDISAEEEVLDWLIEMKVESHVELITRAMLETMVEEVHYLAVYFCETKHHFTIHYALTATDDILIVLQSSRTAGPAIKFWRSWRTLVSDLLAIHAT